MKIIELQSSKSIMNRLLIIKSYFNELQIVGDSSCDDVELMKKALHHLGQKKTYNCGHAGTVLRFLAIRLSRIPGEWKLEGSKRLFSRPQSELQKILSQLGVTSDLKNDKMTIKTNGWKDNIKSIKVSGKDSSQFLSSVLLNSWSLSQPLKIELSSTVRSQEYLNMTIRILKDLGMEIQEAAKYLLIPPHQKVKLKKYYAETDASSAFAIAAMASLNEDVKIKNFRVSDLQPDFVFIEQLKKMGTQIRIKNTDLIIKKTTDLSPLQFNCENAPDLFPVLCCLCSQVNGTSKIYGAPHLIHKESNRIQKTKQLLKSIAVDCQDVEGGLIIKGKMQTSYPKSFSFDPDQDHRMAMAAGVLKKCGYPIKIKEPQVVRKSFPEFWSVIGIKP
jgi:3-phosphoshikimate 1-carboxyvinyltransferase